MLHFKDFYAFHCREIYTHVLNSRVISTPSTHRKLVPPPFTGDLYAFNSWKNSAPSVDGEICIPSAPKRSIRTPLKGVYAPNSWNVITCFSHGRSLRSTRMGENITKRQKISTLPLHRRSLYLYTHERSLRPPLKGNLYVIPPISADLQTRHSGGSLALYSQEISLTSLEVSTHGRLHAID